MENNIRQGKAGKSMPKDPKEEKESTGYLFDPSNYPLPWPLVPFETEPLTSTIDLDHFPKRLIIHDPWNVLATDSGHALGSKKARNAH
ncbi:hypothetical protein H2248_008969 [Termitomyces sp. 'cryptogamus']|nr:hypothetical protein H2248_008969 [Termitomyces sp. 'cryptogamus']